MEWFLFKMLFAKSGLKKTLKKMDKEKLLECEKKSN